MVASFNAWQLLGLVLASGLLWMLYVESKDRLRPEPRWRLASAFGLGFAACWLSLLGYWAMDAAGVPDVQFGGEPWAAVYCFGIVGPLEEGMKLLPAYLIVFRWREFDEPVDGFVYASALALGFASAENLHTVGDGPWLYQLAYTVALPLTHMLFSSIWGLGISHARFLVSRPASRLLWQAGSIALAMLAHGLHDFLIFAYQATLATSALALLIWVLVIWRVHHLHQAHLQAARELPIRPPEEAKLPR
jgi:protease PrsW